MATHLIEAFGMMGTLRDRAMGQRSLDDELDAPWK